MNDLSNSSFIPKQNTLKAKRRIVSHQVYVLSILSYTLVVIALIGATGIFFYDLYAKRALAAEQATLSEEVKVFSQSDMDTVTALDARLGATADLVTSNISFRGVLEAIEDSTIDTIRFLDLSITNKDNAHIALDASIETDTFDSAIFQRSVYARAENIASITVDDAKIALGGNPAEPGVTTKPVISLTALFTVDPITVPYKPVVVPGPNATGTIYNIPIPQNPSVTGGAAPRPPAPSALPGGAAQPPMPPNSQP